MVEHGLYARVVCTLKEMLMRRKSSSFDSVIKTPHLWSGVARSNLERYAVQLCALYAAHAEPNASVRASFDAMYSRLLEDLSPIERGRIIDEVCASLPVGIAAVNTLALFVHAEPDPGVAATAVINIAHVAPLSGDDPLSGLSMLTSLYEHEHTSETVRISVFSGLLLLGDRRVLPILDRLWGLLGRQGRRRVLYAKSGVAYASTVDFLLDRLGKERDEGLFGSLAAALCRLPEETAQGRHPGYVVDVARRLPSSFLESEPTLTLLDACPIEVYGARIAPRLKELAREESEPKVLPMVMAAWGIDLDGVDGDIFSDNWWEIFDPSAAYVNWLVVHDDLGEHREAIEGYNRAIALDPNDSGVYRNRGVARGKLSEYCEAVEDFDRALALDPNDSAAYFNRGLAHYHLNEYRETIEDYDRTIVLDTNDSLAYRKRGIAHGKLGEHREAIADFEHAIAIDPDDSDAFRDRALAHGKLNEYREAIEDYDRAIGLDPDDSPV
jgi:Tfp pilus assembly protein PilF